MGWCGSFYFPSGGVAVAEFGDFLEEPVGDPLGGFEVLVAG